MANRASERAHQSHSSELVVLSRTCLPRQCEQIRGCCQTAAVGRCARSVHEMYLLCVTALLATIQSFQQSELLQSISCSAAASYNLCLASDLLFPSSLLSLKDKSEITITSQAVLSFNSWLQTDPRVSALPSAARTASFIRNYYRRDVRSVDPCLSPGNS